MALRTSSTGRKATGRMDIDYHHSLSLDFLDSLVTAGPTTEGEAPGEIRVMFRAWALARLFFMSWCFLQASSRWAIDAIFPAN